MHTIEQLYECGGCISVHPKKLWLEGITHFRYELCACIFFKDPFDIWLEEI
jgi:hypothetical protein